MARLTNYQMAYLLSLKTHREKYPVVHWIEAEIANGRANSDFGDHCKEVIDEVRVHYGGREDLDYEVHDGEVVAVILGTEFFEDNANPTKEEFDLLEVVDPKWHRELIKFCEDLPELVMWLGQNTLKATDIELMLERRLTVELRDRK